MFSFFTGGGCTLARFSKQVKTVSDYLLCFSSIAKLGDRSHNVVEHLMSTISLLGILQLVAQHFVTSVKGAFENYRSDVAGLCQKLDTGIIQDCSCKAFKAEFELH